MSASRIPFQNLRRVGLGLLLAMALSGVAQAADYVVVKSTDPALARGRALAAGEKVALAAGRTITVMHASGEVLTLKGSSRGVVMPKRTASRAEAARMNLLKVMVAPAPPKAATGGFGRTRSGVCPTPEALKTLDHILQAHAAGCRGQAAAALETYIDVNAR